jgi:t-SNARE complex subunit (syntaxin)
MVTTEQQELKKLRADVRQLQRAYNAMQSHVLKLQKQISSIKARATQAGLNAQQTGADVDRISRSLTKL